MNGVQQSPGPRWGRTSWGELDVTCQTRTLADATAGSFNAADEHGRKVRVVIQQTMHDVRTRDNPHAAPMPGLMSLRTEDGKSVNRIERGVYQVVQTGATLRSDAPDAP